MSNQPAEPLPPPKIETAPYSIPRSWKVGMTVASVMVFLALLGVGLTTTNRAIAPKYWMCLVPVFGLLCVIAAWYRAKQGEGGRVEIVRQIVHWLAIGAFLALDFYIRGTGEETGVAAGYNALLLLALGCFLAGVHLEWLFALVGLLLVGTLIVVVKADQYLWLVVVAAIAIVAAMFGAMRFMARRRSVTRP